MATLTCHGVRSRSATNCRGCPDQPRKIMDTVVGHAAVPVGFTNSFALGSNSGSSELSTLERGTLRALLSRTLGDSNSISLRAGANVRVGPFTTSALARYPGN